MTFGVLGASCPRRAPLELPRRTLFAMDGKGRRGRDVGNCGDRVAFGGARSETVGEVGGEFEGLSGEDTPGVVFRRRGEEPSGRVAVKDNCG